MSDHRPPEWKDEAYLAWIRRLPCLVRGRDCLGPVEAHHTARAYQSMKGPDQSAVPLCHYHHQLVQNFPWVFKDYFKFIPDEEFAVKRYYKTYEALRDEL